MRKETVSRTLLASSLILIMFADGALAQTMTLQELGVRVLWHVCHHRPDSAKYYGC
jgi:hypothetical protein